MVTGDLLPTSWWPPRISWRSRPRDEIIWPEVCALYLVTSGVLVGRMSGRDGVEVVDLFGEIPRLLVVLLGFGVYGFLFGGVLLWIVSLLLFPLWVIVGFPFPLDAEETWLTRLCGYLSLKLRRERGWLYGHLPIWSCAVVGAATVPL